MFTEFHHISFLGMTSNSNSDKFIVKKDQNQIEFKISSTPTSEFPDGSRATASNHDPELDDHEEHEKEEENSEAKSSSDQELNKTPCSGEFEVSANDEDDDHDGFRTPTSSDHKIPVNTQCPPAPKKLRPPPSTKRKAPSPPQLGRRNTVELDLSKEVESMFPPPLQDDLRRKIKRARRDDNTE